MYRTLSLSRCGGSSKSLFSKDPIAASEGGTAANGALRSPNAGPPMPPPPSMAMPPTATVTRQRTSGPRRHRRWRADRDRVRRPHPRAHHWRSSGSRPGRRSKDLVALGVNRRDCSFFWLQSLVSFFIAPVLLFGIGYSCVARPLCLSIPTFRAVWWCPPQMSGATDQRCLRTPRPRAPFADPRPRRQLPRTSSGSDVLSARELRERRACPTKPSRTPSPGR